MPKTKLYIKLLALIIALTVLINISSLEIQLGNSYYFLLLASFLIAVIPLKKPKINYIMVWLIAAAFISIVVNDIPYFFRPFERLLAFVILIALIGPLIFTKKLNELRWQIFKTLNWLIIVLVILSFIGFVLDSNLVYLGRGGFTGFFNHSMMLGPMSGISVLTCTYLATSSPSKKLSLIYYFMAFISLITCIAAGSRAAIIASFLGLIFYFYILYRNSFKNFIKTLAAISFIIIITFPIWENSTENVLDKIKYSQKKGNLSVTRQSIWKIRFNEINASPYFGIGYANDSTQSVDDLYKGGGQVEPGSSWLVVLAMTGILGFIPFIYILGNSFHLIVKGKSSLFFLPYFGALFMFFVVHMIAEGYVLSAGSGLFFYFWSLLGVINIIKNEKI